jgi:hypothetical protein
MCHVYLIFYYYTIIKYKLFISKKKLIMDYTKILLLVKFTKQIHNSLEDSSHPDIFNTIGDIKNEIHNDDFLSLYLSKLNGSEELYLFFSIYLYHKNGDAAKSVKYVLENLKGYRFQVFELGGYKLEECERCSGYGREECEYCDGSGNEECRECDGSGKETCDSCDGDGEIDGEDCSQCGGSGDVSCSSCGGEGSESCHYCSGDGQFECESCNGSGEVETDEQLVDELKDLIYTLNDLDLIFNEDELINQIVYNSRVLKQPYFRNRKWEGEYTIEDLEYEYDLINLDLNHGYVALYYGKVSI